MRPKQFVRAHSMKQEFLIIHTQWVRMSKKKGTVCLLTFAGCTVGPDFQRPAPPDVIGYTSSPLAANLNSSPTMLGDPQNIIDDEAIPGTEYAKSTKIKRT